MSGFAVLDSDANVFNVGFIVLDSDGNPFTVGAVVLDSDGNPFTVGTVDDLTLGGGGGAMDMGEEDRVRRTKKDTVRSDLLKAMGEYIDVIPLDPIVKKKLKYDESDDLESIMWLQ